MSLGTRAKKPTKLIIFHLQTLVNSSTCFAKLFLQPIIHSDCRSFAYYCKYNDNNNNDYLYTCYRFLFSIHNLLLIYLGVCWVR